jgi:hypothetical protein
MKINSGIVFWFIFPFVMLSQHPDGETSTDESFLEHNPFRYSVYQTMDIPFRDFPCSSTNKLYTLRERGFKNVRVNLTRDINRNLKTVVNSVFKKQKQSNVYRLLMLIAPFVNNRFEFARYKALDLPVISRQQIRVGKNFEVRKSAKPAR